MTLTEALVACTRKGVTLVFTPDGVVIDSPKKVTLAPELRAVLGNHRDELVAVLARVGELARTLPAPPEGTCWWIACSVCGWPKLLTQNDAGKRPCSITYGCTGTLALEVAPLHGWAPERPLAVDLLARHLLAQFGPGTVIDRDDPVPVGELEPAPVGCIRTRDGLVFKLTCACDSHPSRGHAAKPVPGA